MISNTWTLKQKIDDIKENTSSKADDDKIYLPRNVGGRGLIHLEMSYKTTLLGLSAYIHVNNDCMIQL